MTPLDERPQIGTIPVDPGSLDQDGVELDNLLAALGAERSAELPADTPSHGWRVLSTQHSELTVVGAPTDHEVHLWRVGQVQRGASDSATRTFSLHPVEQRCRPSNRERAGGLMLRWPATTRSAPDIDLLAIDIVNTGADRWYPQSDSFRVFADIRQPGTPTAGMFYGYVGGQNPGLPLDPGEYVRVRVAIESFGWGEAEPGEYEVHAVLIDLGLRSSEPVLVELSEHVIRDHQPRRSVPPTPPPAI
jgi:hypothetical protein